MRERRRRQYGTGSVYQRASDGRWVATIEAGYTTSGARRRITVTGKTEAEAKRRLRDKTDEIAKAGQAKRAARGQRLTVKAWADEWLEMRRADLGPKTWDTNRGQIRNWIVPTIGAVKLADLSPADFRAVEAAQRKDGQAASSITRCRNVLRKMLKDAIVEGHPVPTAVVEVAPRAKRKSAPRKEREGLPIDEALICLTAARDTLPHHSRWDIAFLQGLRQGEALGLTWAAVDLDAALLTISWQLQPLPYLDKHDRSKGFRIPDDYEVRHLWGRFHLVRPKSDAGWRVIPLVPWAVETLRAWRDIQPPNPYGLVWTRTDGRPIDKADDAEEWRAIQHSAEVTHHSGRYYVGHEIRHTTATLLLEAGVDPFIITAILGHTDIETSRIYMTRRAQQARPAMEAVSRALGMG